MDVFEQLKTVATYLDEINTGNTLTTKIDVSRYGLMISTSKVVNHQLAKSKKLVMWADLTLAGVGAGDLLRTRINDQRALFAAEAPTNA